MPNPNLDERSAEVLRSLIRAHVATGEPVGSESLSRLLSRPLSPATVRNIMADLEKLGLLDHPHTSAGRVPTDEGYRYFVDALMARETLPAKEAAAIRTGLRPREGSPLEVLDNAVHLLSRLSRNVAFVLAPDIARTSFRHVDFVRLPEPRILAVLVDQTGLVTHKVLEVQEELSQDDLQACANYLNQNFSGMRLPEVRARLLDLMQEEKALYDSLMQKAVRLGERAFAGEGEGSLLMDGTANMLEHREVDLEQMRALFKTFEEKGRLVKILTACLSDEGIRIVIGRENSEPELRATSLVAASYPLAGEAGWGVGVLGSTRMEYARVVALVDHVAREISRALREIRA
ncbi:MAG TPA: heat-inducible transcriptional repressor HrcA [Vicinamibacteria bacterium]|nr:heat-inducible transcriptional repressor HrcA [Vicinamibacteria bacterium]